MDIFIILNFFFIYLFSFLILELAFSFLLWMPKLNLLEPINLSINLYPNHNIFNV